MNGAAGFAVPMEFPGIRSEVGTIYGSRRKWESNTVYIASDRTTVVSDGQFLDGNLGFDGWDHTQVHETGNALSNITGKFSTGSMAHRSERQHHEDQGSRFEHCVFSRYRKID